MEGNRKSPTNPGKYYAELQGNGAYSFSETPEVAISSSQRDSYPRMVVYRWHQSWPTDARRRNNSWTDKFAALQAKQYQMESKFSSLHEKVTKNLQQQITEQSTRTDSMLDWMKKQQGIIEKMQETLIKLTEEHQHGRASKGSHNSNP